MAQPLVFRVQVTNEISGLDKIDAVRVLLPLNDSSYTLRDYYYKTGNLYREGTFVMVKKNNSIRPAGRKSMYSSDFWHKGFGSFTFYHENGSPAFSGYYLEGKKTGPFWHWYPDGKLHMIALYNDQDPLPSLSMEWPYLLYYFRDSLGNVQVNRGEGVYCERLDGVAIDSGQVKLGKRKGPWKTHSFAKGGIVEVTFDQGLSGSDTTSGVVLSFVAINELLEDWDPREFMIDISQQVNSNFVYPEEARQNGIEGRIFVSMTFEPNGTVSNLKIARGVHPLLDEAAMKAVRTIRVPPFKFKDGTPYRFSYTVPIYVKL